ncbi:MAG: class I tRNA ligase family protein, partial [Candidatus Hydrogenedentes bacterium]|nr:class I tRNA ligase family protein [Candidatus Hydrogenedentota bacterium]
VEKMSKSRYNVVNPDAVVESYGADSMRLYEMFMGPLERDKPWTDEGIQGVHRFMKRVWSLFVADDGSLHPRIVEAGGDREMLRVLHYTIKEVTAGIENLQFNTAIARMMEFVNAAMKSGPVEKTWADQFVLVLSAFAPHIAEELWERLGHGSTLAYEPWPVYDEAMLVVDTIEVPVQVNGKLRSVLRVPRDAQKDEVVAAARADSKVAPHIEGKQVVKEIYVAGKLLNLVVK